MRVGSIKVTKNPSFTAVKMNNNAQKFATRISQSYAGSNFFNMLYSLDKTTDEANVDCYVTTVKKRPAIEYQGKVYNYTDLNLSFKDKTDNSFLFRKDITYLDLTSKSKVDEMLEKFNNKLRAKNNHGRVFKPNI